MHNREKETILIVEDQAVNRAILRRILLPDYQVVEAVNGKEAIDQIDKCQRIRAVMLDLVMPVMNGYEVLELLHQRQKLESLPVIVMTGEDSTDSENLALESGAWDFIKKPFQPQVLLNRLKNAIARSEIAVFRKMEYYMEHDALTDLYNRNKMFSETRKMIDENPSQEFLFVRYDIERFRSFNSSFGEYGGNQLLCFVADCTRKLIQEMKYCVYGRMEADIFCMCIPNDSDFLVHFLHELMAELKSFRDDYYITVAVGAYVVDEPHISVEEMFIRAGMGSHKCKDDVTKEIGYYDKEEGERAAKELEIINEMQSALDHEDFQVYFQPKFELTAHTACGAEALTRWIHPKKGLISPGQFIPVFEKNGFIAQLDYYVWEHVCMSMQTWRNQGHDLFPISVNISRISLYNPQLVKIIVDLTDSYQIPHELFYLEITESAYMSNPDLMENTIKQFHEEGFILMMDDFGSSYSSLNTLKDIDMDILKVDMKFLPTGEEVRKGEIVLASVVRMAKWLGMTVVVEGVETGKQVSFLAGIGCDYIQGFYFAKPMPLPDYEQNYVIRHEENLSDSQLSEEPTNHSVILVIDDDEMNGEILMEYFKNLYQIYVCNSAEDGMKYLQFHSSNVRLILLDNYMPGMSGMDFLEFYKDDPKIGPIPKIMITGSDFAADMVKAFQLGAYDYITKPFVQEVVMARVGHVFEMSNQLRNFAIKGEKYKSLSEHDKMTGLLNKATCQEKCNRALIDHPMDHYALLVIDLDNFKKVNDEWGHLKGDQVLQHTAKALQSEFRRTDIIGRFGGDEFVVLMVGIIMKDVICRKVQAVQDTIHHEYKDNMQMEVSLSIGIACSQDGDNFDSLFHKADQALYVAKNTGKGKYAFFDA